MKTKSLGKMVYPEIDFAVFGLADSKILLTLDDGRKRLVIEASPGWLAHRFNELIRKADKLSGEELERLRIKRMQCRDAALNGLGTLQR